MKPIEAKSLEAPAAAPVPLEAVLRTDDLNRRPERPPEYEKESRALVALTQALADSPRTILQTLAETTVRSLDVDSAGLSLLTADRRHFYWPAVAGVWQPYVGGSTPRDFGPCGDVLDRSAPLLFTHCERRYTYLQSVTPPIEEGLLVPFYVEGKAVGTLWAIMHSERRRFDAEDLRLLVSLSRFASAAYQTELFRNAAEQRVSDMEHGRATAQESRRAALNLMEDAVHSRQVVEALYAEVQQSEARYRELIHALPAATYTCDVEGRITLYNQAAVELWQREPDLGKDKWCGSWRIYRTDGTELPLDECPMAVTLREGRPVRGQEILVERPDGSRVRVLPYPEPILDAAGHVVGAVNMLVDLTDLRTAEQALREAHRRKDEFLATLAHELRNPLAPLTNCLALLRRAGSDPAAVERSREMMARQVGKLKRLVDDLLDVARINRGTIELRNEDVNMTSVVEQAVESVRSEMDGGGHELEVLLPPEPVWVKGDRLRLEQIIVNLLQNAVKYTNPGGRLAISLDVGRHGDATRDEEAVVRVRDNGIGIDPEMVSRIFDFFVRADVSYSRRSSGLGVGLSLVKCLVERHGGSVEAHSAGLGQGSEFVVRLPLPSGAREERTEQPRTGPSDAPSSATRRILVVDDNVDAAESEAMLLQCSGHEVRVVHNGLAALDAASTFRPEVVLLDIGMPGMDGYETARRWRRQEGGRRTTLVAVSGYGSEDDRRRSREAGFDAHLVKPTDIETLSKILTPAESAATRPGTPERANRGEIQRDRVNAD